MTWHTTSLGSADVVPGSAVPVDVMGTPLLIAAVDQAWWAIEDRCSHAGCAFSEDGEVDRHIAICDCHGSEFDIRTGAVLVPPATAPIRIFPVRIAGGRIEVEL